MELISEQTPRTQTQTIALDVTIKFLSLAHSNTVVDLQSQAFGYSHSHDDPVRYLCIVPFPGRSFIDDEVNESEYERTFI